MRDPWAKHISLYFPGERVITASTCLKKILLTYVLHYMRYK